MSKHLPRAREHFLPQGFTCLSSSAVPSLLQLPGTHRWPAVPALPRPRPHKVTSLLQSHLTAEESAGDTFSTFPEVTQGVSGQGQTQSQGQVVSRTFTAAHPTPTDMPEDRHSTSGSRRPWAPCPSQPAPAPSLALLLLKVSQRTAACPWLPPTPEQGHHPLVPVAYAWGLPAPGTPG